MSNRATFRELLYSNNGYYDRYIIIEDIFFDLGYTVFVNIRSFI